MIRGFYTARAGLMAHQEHMNTISNNLSNTNTHGFKPMRTAFADLIYQNLNRDEVENSVQVGHGVKINKNDILMEKGAFAATDRDFDFAIVDDDAMFAVELSDGTTAYTRAGNFSLSHSGDDTFYLVTGAGDRVLDAEGQPIEITYDENTGKIDMEEMNIGVFKFPNPYGVLAEGNNYFLQSDTSGEPEALENPEIKSGYLESSAVNVANEMAHVIESSKAFSFSSRMIQVADEIEQTINSLR